MRSTHRIQLISALLCCCCCFCCRCCPGTLCSNNWQSCNVQGPAPDSLFHSFIHSFIPYPTLGNARAAPPLPPSLRLVANILCFNELSRCERLPSLRLWSDESLETILSVRFVYRERERGVHVRHPQGHTYLLQRDNAWEIVTMTGDGSGSDVGGHGSGSAAAAGMVAAFKFVSLSTSVTRPSSRDIRILLPHATTTVFSLLTCGAHRNDIKLWGLFGTQKCYVPLIKPWYIIIFGTYILPFKLRYEKSRNMVLYIRTDMFANHFKQLNICPKISRTTNYCKSCVVAVFA